MGDRNNNDEGGNNAGVQHDGNANENEEEAANNHDDDQGDGNGNENVEEPANNDNDDDDNQEDPGPNAPLLEAGKSSTSHSDDSSSPPTPVPPRTLPPHKIPDKSTLPAKTSSSQSTNQLFDVPGPSRRTYAEGEIGPDTSLTPLLGPASLDEHGPHAASLSHESGLDGTATGNYTMRWVRDGREGCISSNMMPQIK